MGLSAQELTLLAVELLAALALAAVWLGDRERTYTLWWAISHATLPLPALLHGGMSSSQLVIAILHLSNAIQAVTLLAGVIVYRTQRSLPARYVGLAILVIWLLFYPPTLVVGYVWGVYWNLLVLGGAFLTSMMLMWSVGRIERVAALCFALRSGFAVALLVLVINGDVGSRWIAHVPSFSGLMGVGTALALLIAAYQRSLDRLREQYRLLELSHEITAQLHSGTDELSLTRNALAMLTERLGWKQGAFFHPTAEPRTLIPVAIAGPDGGVVSVGVPFTVTEGGMIATVLRTHRANYSAGLSVDLRVAEHFRNLPSIASNPSFAVIPVTHGSELLGVITLTKLDRDELSGAEILTLENLGQVIGIGLANLRNLQELAYRANHDTLTGLGNRAALHDYLDSHGADCYAVLLFDLDRFKLVNDALGHSVGDRLLQALTERLQQYLTGRPAALFRLGGDEFVIIHAFGGNHSVRERAEVFASELGGVIAQPLLISDLSLRTPASIGVALAPDHGAGSHELLRRADVAMYHAKHSGSGMAFYRRDIDAYNLEHLTLLSAISTGLEEDQFVLHYQPYIDLATGNIAGCEALIRWHHPTRGLVGAADFMPLVETTDMIRALTHRVIDIALADAGRWKQRGIDIRIAINLSARNILDPEMPAYLARAAAEHKVEPSRIQLEITETILIKDPVSAANVLQNLVEAGFTLALDDFGTGYSSLAYLARFPIHTLKIDRSFVREMLNQPQSRAIVESTISLARGLGLKVTAEGVELESEASLLRALDCDYVQGYLFSRPIPEAQLMVDWLDDAAAMAV